MSNGPAFAPDGTVAYFADTFARQILCFRLDASGRPLSQDTFATIPDSDGYPHGMTTDIAGTLYVGHWDGARINRWSPDSTALPPIPVLARNATSLAFGGDEMKNVLITTASLLPGQESDPVLNWTGELLVIQSEVAGLVEPPLAADL